MCNNLFMPTTTKSDELTQILAPLQGSTAGVADVIKVYEMAMQRMLSVPTEYVPRVIGATSTNQFAR